MLVKAIYQDKCENRVHCRDKNTEATTSDHWDKAKLCLVIQKNWYV